MGNAAVQGRLWGAKPQDYAEYLEQVGLPLMGAALDAARVRRGTALLDAGGGAWRPPCLPPRRGRQRHRRLGGTAGHRARAAARGGR